MRQPLIAILARPDRRDGAAPRTAPDRERVDRCGAATNRPLGSLRENRQRGDRNRTAANFTCRAPPASWPARSDTAATACRYSARSIDALRYFSSSIDCSSSSLRFSSFSFSGSLICAATAPRCSTAKCPATSPSPFSGDGALTPSPLPVSSISACSVARRFCVSKNFAVFASAYLEGFERADHFVLVGVRRRIAQRFNPVAREIGRVLLGAGFGRGDHHAARPSRSDTSDPPLELVMLTTS